MIAQSIGQAFSVAYQEFLRVSGINPRDLSQREYSDMLSSPDMYNEDLVHFSKSENSRAVSRPNLTFSVTPKTLKQRSCPPQQRAYKQALPVKSLCKHVKM